LIIISTVLISCGHTSGTKNLNPATAQRIEIGVTKKIEVAKLLGQPKLNENLSSLTVVSFLISKLESFSREKCGYKSWASIPLTKEKSGNPLFAAQHIKLPEGFYDLWIYYLESWVDLWPLPGENKCYMLAIVFNDEDIVVEKIFGGTREGYWHIL